jgi:hypothetical protein
VIFVINLRRKDENSMKYCAETVVTESVLLLVYRQAKHHTVQWCADKKKILSIPVFSC